jgi:hypothetical protein
MNDHADLVWYVCYGSNILYERFMCYIRGGIFYANGKGYPGCTDKTPPQDFRAVIIPYEMYFGNSSPSWGNTGVAFLDIEKPSSTPGRMYLITEAQFNEIHCQEGYSADWYGTIVQWDEYEGYPVKTFTNSQRREENPPCDAYCEVIKKGKEEIQKMTPVILGQRIFYPKFDI